MSADILAPAYKAKSMAKSVVKVVAKPAAKAAAKPAAKAAAKPAAKAAAKPAAKAAAKPAAKAAAGLAKKGASRAKAAPRLKGKAARRKMPVRGGAAAFPLRKSVGDRELVLDKIQRWASNRAEAKDWFLRYEIPEFGGKTASELLKKGNKQALLDYIEGIELGSYV